MFKHQGSKRNLGHNLKITSLLSFVAGMVNVAGFLAVQRLTTNVTGYFAFFVDEVFKLNFKQGIVYFLYIFFFFLGSFFSSLLVEFLLRKSKKYVYVIPTAIESVILLVMGFFGEKLILENPVFIAYGSIFPLHILKYRQKDIVMIACLCYFAGFEAKNIKKENLNLCLVLKK